MPKYERFITETGHNSKKELDLKKSPFKKFEGTAHKLRNLAKKNDIQTTSMMKSSMYMF
jgi:hypothetical protein